MGLDKYWLGALVEVLEDKKFPGFLKWQAVESIIKFLISSVWWRKE